MVDILHKVGVKAPMDAVYKALATRDGAAAWWSQFTTGESKVGSALKFSFRDGPEGAELGNIEVKVLELVPNTRVLWQVLDGPAEWAGTHISFDLKQEDEYAVVLFKHTGWKEPVEFMHHCSTKWAVFMLSLKALAETGKGQPNPHDVKIDNWN